MALEDVLKNSMLAAVDTSVSHLGLHDGFPATSINEISGGAPAYARQVVAWDAPSGGTIAMTGTEVFDCAAAAVVSAEAHDAAPSATRTEPQKAPPRGPQLETRLQLGVDPLPVTGYARLSRTRPSRLLERDSRGLESCSSREGDGSRQWTRY